MPTWTDHALPDINAAHPNALESLIASLQCASSEYIRLKTSLLSSAFGSVQAADLIVNTLKAISNSRPGMAQKFLDLAVLVLQHGEVERVIYRLGDWSRTADPSLMRHFIFHALEACAPPYSAYFASFLLTYALLHHRAHHADILQS